MTVLDEIYAHTREEVAARKRVAPMVAVRARAQEARPPLDFVAALCARHPRPALIAEVKRSSPSRGLLAPDFDPLRLAQVYAENGAAALSVLTDERYFGGSLDHLRQIAICQIAACDLRLPLLRKDFIGDPYQVYEARAAGAAAVLLIVALLSPEQLSALQALAGELGMAALVEVHTREELEVALACNARLIGINNRNLADFSVDLTTALRLRPQIPSGVCVVAESGIHTAADVSRLAEAGVDAILVGEALVTAPDVAAAVRSLAGVEFSIMSDRTRVKICGLTTLDDALAAVDAGADMLGFNFYPPSPRYLAPGACARIVGTLRSRRAAVETVGVFVNASLAEIEAILDDCGLDLAQLSGDEPAETLAALGERAFKGIRPTSAEAARADLVRYACDRRRRAPALLLDATRPGQYGGTGQVADWDMAAVLACDYPILLAGGLGPQNVAAAASRVRPWGVDVASGVESAPGRKDRAKMTEFIAAVRRAAISEATFSRDEAAS